MIIFQRIRLKICVLLVAICPTVFAKQTSYLGIFLKPSNAILQNLKVQSKHLQSIGAIPSDTAIQSMYVPLLLIHNYPHSAVQEIMKITKDAAKHQYKFMMTLSTIQPTKEHGLFWIIADTSGDLRALRNRLAMRISNIRILSHHPQSQNIKNISDLIEDPQYSTSISKFAPGIILLVGGHQSLAKKYLDQFHNAYKKKRYALPLYGHGIALVIGTMDHNGRLIKEFAQQPLLSKITLKLHAQNIK